MWKLSNRFDPKAVYIANRHYSRQKPGTNQFVPPGSCLVLLSLDEKSLWVTSVPKFVKHRWNRAWVNTFFRKEGDGIASEMILEAIAITRWFYGSPPEQGMITFIDRTKVKPTYRHSKPTWGFSYLKAGFEQQLNDDGTEILVKDRMLVFRLPPKKMPDPSPIVYGQLQLISTKPNWSIT